MFSPPPRKSVGFGRPFSWKLGRNGRPPPPTCNTSGTPASSSRAHTPSRSGWVGECVRGGSDGDEPVVATAEVGHGAVVGAGAAVEEVGIVVEELGRRERREHQLLVEP